ncbi:MAG: hypothetical protein J6569_10695, partial [Gilliamella sp.]|uniref:hypothetical protein n=1 Tax=Gilliamella sp. TaxID=1891236 RepID=UPI0025D7D174
TEDLLGIKLSDGRTFTSQNNSSSPTAPIKLPNVGDTFADVEMIVPPSSDSININDLVTQGKWRDDDGDGQGAGGVTALGSISLAITDKDGNTINRSDALDICNAPYKVTLSSTGGNLATQYGEPRSSTFSGGTAEYYITLPSPPVICAVRPNLLLGGTTGLGWDDPRFAGPANIWDPVKGFLVQSTNPSSYGLNFPTTGSDGLYFDLLIAGVDASQLSWTVTTRGDITATVSWVRPRSGSFMDPSWGSIVQYDSWIRDKSKNVTRVTLNGPEARSQWSNSNPSQITVPSLPQTFELIGRDRSGNEVRYGFELRQWFVNRGGQLKTYSDQLAWCNSLGYRMPRVRDLTNSNYNNLGATPSSSVNYYMRYIGAGFFTEWGLMNYYADAGFIYYNWWTSDAAGSNSLLVNSGDGNVAGYSNGEDHPGLCSAP